MSNRTRTGNGAGLPHPGNLLNDAVRREISELNRLYLDRALDPAGASDPWFQLPPDATERLRGSPEDVRARLAQSPLTLFELNLPPVPAAGIPGVADVALLSAADAVVPEAESRRSFGLVALGVARRLAEGVPMAPRLAFGLDEDVERRLATLTPRAAYSVACWPGLVRPRWPAHVHFWRRLADAASDPRDEPLQWAHAAGLCLLGQCERTRPPGFHAPLRPTRPVHRRRPPGKADVPC